MAGHSSPARNTLSTISASCRQCLWMYDGLREQPLRLRERGYFCSPSCKCHADLEYYTAMAMATPWF